MSSNQDYYTDRDGRRRYYTRTTRDSVPSQEDPPRRQESAPTTQLPYRTRQTASDARTTLEPYDRRSSVPQGRSERRQSRDGRAPWTQTGSSRATETDRRRRPDYREASRSREDDRYDDRRHRRERSHRSSGSRGRGVSRRRDENSSSLRKRLAGVFKAVVTDRRGSRSQESRGRSRSRSRPRGTSRETDRRERRSQSRDRQYGRERTSRSDRRSERRDDRGPRYAQEAQFRRDTGTQSSRPDDRSRPSRSYQETVNTTRRQESRDRLRSRAPSRETADRPQRRPGSPTARVVPPTDSEIELQQTQRRRGKLPDRDTRPLKSARSRSRHSEDDERQERRSRQYQQRMAEKMRTDWEVFSRSGDLRTVRTAEKSAVKEGFDRRYRDLYSAKADLIGRGRASHTNSEPVTWSSPEVDPDGSVSWEMRMGRNSYPVMRPLMRPT